MEFTEEELREAKRQIDSTLHKLRETAVTLEGKENAAKLKPQITLAKRRIRAMEIANALLEKELNKENREERVCQSRSGHGN